MSRHALEDWDPIVPEGATRFFWQPDHVALEPNWDRLIDFIGVKATEEGLVLLNTRPVRGWMLADGTLCGEGHDKSAPVWVWWAHADSD